MQHQSCLLVTSRAKTGKIATLEGEFLPVRSLVLKGLQSAAVKKLLNAKGLVGSTDEVSKLITYYQGNPLALKIAANSILELFNGDISAFIQQGTMVFNGIQKILAQQINGLSSIEAQILYFLSLHQNSLSLAQLEADMESEEIAPAQLLEALESLTWRCLVESHTAGLSLQPWVREYVIKQFPDFDSIQDNPHKFFSSTLSHKI